MPCFSCKCFHEGVTMRISHPGQVGANSTTKSIIEGMSVATMPQHGMVAVVILL